MTRRRQRLRLSRHTCRLSLQTRGRLRVAGSCLDSFWLYLLSVFFCCWIVYNASRFLCVRRSGQTRHKIFPLFMAQPFFDPVFFCRHTQQGGTRGSLKLVLTCISALHTHTYTPPSLPHSSSKATCLNTAIGSICGRSSRLYENQTNISRKDPRSIPHCSFLWRWSDNRVALLFLR